MKSFLIIMLIITFSVSVIFIESGCKEIKKSSEQNSTETEVGETINTSSKIAVNKIAFVSKVYPNNNNEIYIMYLEGSMKTRLTNNQANDLWPCFSPDGTKIAFISDRDGNSEIYIMNTDGSEQVNLTNNIANDFNPSFSPDGSKICFVSGRDGNGEIYIMNTDGSEQVNLTNNSVNDGHPSLSPDGSKIIFESQHYEIYKSILIESNSICIMNIDGSDQSVITLDNTYDLYASFSPDGSNVIYESNSNGRNYKIYSSNIYVLEQARDSSYPVYFHELWTELGGGRYPVYSPIMDETRAGAAKLEITIPETDEMGNIFPEDLGDYYLSMQLWAFGVLDNLCISKSGFIEYATLDSGLLYNHKIGKISKESIEKLSELIEDSGFFNFKDVYESPEDSEDEGSIKISVFRDGEVKSVEPGVGTPGSFYSLVSYLQKQVIKRLQDDLRYGTFIKAEKLVSSTSKKIISNEELEAHPLLAKAIQNPGWLIYVDTLTNAGLDDYIANNECYFYLNFEGNNFKVSVYEKQK